MNRPIKPFDRLVYWITERESIRLKKEAGLPKPWTTDPILQKYRFTNVRRMDDKVSQWLLKNWYEPHFDHPNMLGAAALARFFNKPETLEPIEPFVFCSGKPKFDRMAKLLRKMKTKGTIFNSAYLVRGNNGVDKIESVLEYNIRPLLKLKNVIDSNSMEITWGNILQSYGLGSFTAGQIVADLRWAVSGEWADRNDWAPMGPGSKRGMNRLHGREKKAPLKQDQFLAELRNLREKLREHIPSDLHSRLEMIDFQNVLCETDKFNRMLNGEGRPKSKYPGVE